MPLSLLLRRRCREVLGVRSCSIASVLPGPTLRVGDLGVTDPFDTVRDGIDSDSGDFSPAAFAALASIEERIVELERGGPWVTWDRLEAAEQRVAELEAALREIREEFRSLSTETGYDGDPVELMAAAALASGKDKP